MSIESANQWILKLSENEELRQQAEAAGNFEARQALAKEHGFEFSKKEIQNAVEACKGKLSEDDLDNVAGGMSQGVKNVGTHVAENAGADVGADVAEEVGGYIVDTAIGAAGAM